MVSAVQDAQCLGSIHLTLCLETEYICQTQAQPEGQGSLQAGTVPEQRKPLGMGQQQQGRMYFGSELFPAL